MKRLNLMRVLVLGLCIYGASYGADSKLVTVEARSLFVPVGFDDNDEIQVVLDGYLPDTCHRVAAPAVEIDQSGRTITVQQMAYQFTSVCFDVTVPFTSVISLGRLDDGEYSVATRDGALSRKLTVNSGGAIPGPDDYLYAPIDTARVERRMAGDRMEHVAILGGRYTNTCMRVVDFKVFDHGSLGTVELLPIMAIINPASGDKPCQSREVEYEVETRLPVFEKKGRYLLHVRSLNGAAVNVVFDR